MKLADILTRQYTKTVTRHRMGTPFCNSQAPAYEKWVGSIIKAIKFSDDYNLTSIVWEATDWTRE